MTFQFNRIRPQDPAKGFEQLSQTIRAVGEHFKQNDAMERDELKAHNAYQNDLDSIFGIVGKTKGFTDKEYKNLVQTQNALAQKEGVIKAYENFSYLDSVSEERANIRLNAYQSEMKKYIPAMSNATTPLDYDSAESAVYDILGLNGGVVGVDSTGNDVTMDFEFMDTAEIVAMSKGLTKNRIIVDSAVSDLRQEEAIRSSESRYQIELADGLELWDLEETRGLLGSHFKDLANEYYGYGVQGINALTLNTIQAKVVDIMAYHNFNSSSIEHVSGILDMFENDVTMREGAGVFGAEGTDNFIKLENIRSDALRMEVANEKRASTEATETIDKVTDLILKDAVDRVMDGTPMTPEKEREIKLEIGRAAAEKGIYEINTILNNVSSLITSQRVDDSARRAEILSSATQFRHSRPDIIRLKEESLDLVKNGLLSIEGFGTVTTKLDGYLLSLGTYSDQKNRISEDSLDFSKIMSDVLLLNDENLTYQDEAGALTYSTKFAQDNKPDAKRIMFINIYDEMLDDIALTGGKLENQIPVEYSPEERAFLLSSGIPEFKLNEAVGYHNMPIVFPEGPAEPGSQAELARARSINNKSANYAFIQGLEQMLEYRTHIATIQGELELGIQR